MHLASLPLYVWAQLGFEKLIYTWFTVVTSTVLKHTCSTHWSCLQFKYRALLKDKLKKKKKNTKLRNHEKLLFMSNSQCYECLIVHLPFFFFFLMWWSTFQMAILHVQVCSRLVQSTQSMRLSNWLMATTCLTLDSPWWCVNLLWTGTELNFFKCFLQRKTNKSLVFRLV